MTTRIVHPDQMSADALDDWLARGWFRVGPSMITCRFLFFEDALRSVIWTRLPLRDHVMRPGLQRRLRRAERRFTLRVDAARPDAQREEVYGRYLTVAPGERAETLAALLHGDPPRALEAFDTREISFWDGERLAAFHWFDLGAEAVQSILGAYDPAYARDSLGFVGLLAELRWARERGLRHHYPGYVLPGTPSMAYKLRVGPLEALDPDGGGWVPYDALRPADHALARLDERLGQVAARLAHRLEARVLGYPDFGAHHATPDQGEGRRAVRVPALGERLLRNVDQPRFLLLGPSPQQPAPLVLYDPERARWRLAAGWRVRATGLLPDGRRVTVEQWMEEDPVLVDRDPDAFAREVLQRLRQA